MIPIKISPGFLTEIDNSKIDMDKQKKKKNKNSQHFDKEQN